VAEVRSISNGCCWACFPFPRDADQHLARIDEAFRGFELAQGRLDLVPGLSALVFGLAQRSAQAAREIKDLIGASVAKVDAGSRQVADAGAAMKEIVAQVARVTDLIGEITNAAAEQASGIGQINDAIAIMDKSTQQNAALVEQSAAAAQSLQEQAGQLTQTVAVFKLGQFVARA
jgi:methyl-accepting chemotaxis protein